MAFRARNRGRPRENLTVFVRVALTTWPNSICVRRFCRAEMADPVAQWHFGNVLARVSLNRSECLMHFLVGYSHYIGPSGMCFSCSSGSCFQWRPPVRSLSRFHTPRAVHTRRLRPRYTLSHAKLGDAAKCAHSVLRRCVYYTIRLFETKTMRNKIVQ